MKLMAELLVRVLLGIFAMQSLIKASQENDSTFFNATEKEFVDVELTTSVALTESTVAYVENVTKLPILSDAKSPEDSWTPDANPIFKAFKDFLFQERSGNLQMRTASPNGTNQTTADRILEVLNDGFQDVITTLKDEMDSVTSEIPISQDIPSPVPAKDESETSPLWDLMRLNLVPPKRRHSTKSFANLTMSCSSCYSELSSCVQKCFVKHNCKDVERNARKCPPVPTRLCNPFTPWSPVNQCQIDSDCESPLLCCDDGCVKRCSSGVWRT